MFLLGGGGLVQMEMGSNFLVGLKIRDCRKFCNHFRGIMFLCVFHFPFY